MERFDEVINVMTKVFFLIMTTSSVLFVIIILFKAIEKGFNYFKNLKK